MLIRALGSIGTTIKQLSRLGDCNWSLIADPGARVVKGYAESIASKSLESLST